MMSGQSNNVRVYNKILHNFRALHVDGAYGGVTPNGLININFYSERLSIPKATDYSVDDEKNSLVKISDSPDSKNGLIREFEMGVYMTLNAAGELHKWIGEQLTIIRNH